MVRRIRLNILAAIAISAALVALAGFAVAQEAEVHWTYEGGSGPAAWHELDPDYVACGAGVEQSPVDIPTDVATVNTNDVVYQYQASEIEVLNNGHAIQVDYDEGSEAVIDGVPRQLLQFHFHSPSEHTFDGEHAALEVHLVHADAAGNLAVIGLLVVEGEANPVIDPLWSLLPTEVGGTLADESVEFDVAELLPDDLSYYSYRGSLTTPPCTEDVDWHVLATPLRISGEKIAAYRAILDGTARPTQPMGDRAFLDSPGGT